MTEDQWRLARIDRHRAAGRLGIDDVADRSQPAVGDGVADLGIGGLLLTASGLLSGRLVLFRRRRWLTAPAAVTASND